MRAEAIAKVAALIVAAGFAKSICLAQTVVGADFSKGDFAALGWKAKGAWDVFLYPKEAANNPGPSARFAANKRDGSLTKSFVEIKNPKKLTVSLDYGWGWGDAGQAADAVSFMLLGPGENGYDEQVFNKVVLATSGREPAVATAIPATDFLNSIGIDSTFPDRGQPLTKTIEMVKYAGFRWVRGGIEGLTDQGPHDRADLS